jgi:hypothetical protein
MSWVAWKKLSLNNQYLTSTPAFTPFSPFYALFRTFLHISALFALFRPPPKMMEIIAAVCNSMSIFLRSFKARKSKSKVEKKVKIINEIDLS